MPGGHDAVLLLAGGDMCFSDHPLCRGFGVGAGIARHGAGFPLAGLAPLLAEADLALGNFETAMAARPGVEPAPFCCPPAVAGALAAHGFGLVNVANNHSLQHGEAAFAETLAHLQAAGVQPVGVPGAGDQACEPVLRRVRGQSVAFLAYAFTPENFHPGARCYARGTTAQVLADVARARGTADHVVVTCHWGVELADDPTPGQVALGRAIIDAGADVVLGHHPHVWQAVEDHGQGTIFYSLGDLVFDLAWCARARRTGVARIHLARGQRPRWEVAPLVINGRHQPVPADGRAAAAFLAGLTAAAARLRAIPAAEPGAPPPASYLAAVRRHDAANQRAKVLHVLGNLHRMGLSRFGAIALKQVRSLAGHDRPGPP